MAANFPGDEQDRMSNWTAEERAAYVQEARAATRRAWAKEHAQTLEKQWWLDRAPDLTKAAAQTAKPADCACR